MAKNRVSELPSFDEPPVMEVVFGVQFQEIRNLLIPHFGQLWRSFRKEYSKIAEKPPLASTFELMVPIEHTIELSDTPPLPRVWFLTEDESYIIQVQRDRFLHNWKRVKADDVYPRFDSLYPNFCDRYENFVQFLSAAGLDEPVVNQLEITYVNHVQFNFLEDDIGVVFLDHVRQKRKDRFLARPESFNWRSSFELPKQQGRLHIVIRSAKSVATGSPLVSVEITARGVGPDVDAWFKMARKHIVKGFEDITSEEYRTEHWKQR